MRVLLAVLCSAAATAAMVSAQQLSYRSGADTVSIYATVLDDEGRLVTGLTADDFEVYDNGKRQELTVFAAEQQPITIVVMLDRSGSVVRHFERVREAAEQFVANLKPGDRARVGSFSNRIQIDPEDFTDDREELIRILHDELQEPGTTPLWNATAEAMTALAREPGRRVVLLFTDGYDTPIDRRRNVSFRQVRDRSVTEGIMVYGVGLANSCGRSVGNSGPVWPRRPRFQWRGPRRPPIIPRPPVIGGPFPRPRPGEPQRPPSLPPRVPQSVTCLETRPDPNLRELARVGGGGYFELSSTDDLAATFTRVAEELHQQYLLAFTPEVLDGQLHRIDVRVRRPGLAARARESYLAEAE